jgi:hypothetical protein
MIRMCLEKGKRMVMLRITALDGSKNRVVETIGMIRILPAPEQEEHDKYLLYVVSTHALAT